jgi:hypothetical protein
MNGKREHQGRRAWHTGPVSTGKGNTGAEVGHSITVRGAVCSSSHRFSFCQNQKNFENREKSRNTEKKLRKPANIKKLEKSRNMGKIR